MAIDFKDDINFISLTSKPIAFRNNCDFILLPNQQLSFKTLIPNHQDNNYLDVLINLNNVDCFIYNINTISIYTCDYIYHHVPKEIAQLCIEHLNFYPLNNNTYINPFNIIKIDTDDMITIDMAGLSINVQDLNILKNLKDKQYSLPQHEQSKINPTSKIITELFNHSLWFNDENIDDYSKRLCITTADQNKQTLQLSFNYKGNAKEIELLKINHYTQTISPQPFISFVEKETIISNMKTIQNLTKTKQIKL